MSFWSVFKITLNYPQIENFDDVMSDPLHRNRISQFDLYTEKVSYPVRKNLQYVLPLVWLFRESLLTLTHGVHIKSQLAITPQYLHRCLNAITNIKDLSELSII